MHFFVRHLTTAFTVTFVMLEERNMDHIQYALAPLKYFYLISTTSATLSDNKLLCCLWYRLYVVIFFLIPFFTIAHMLYLAFDSTKVSPFNFNVMLIYYLVLQYALNVYPMITAKKMRINKVIRALEELDFKMHFKNFDLCKKIRKKIVFWVILMFTSHVVVHGILVMLLLKLPKGLYIVKVSFWFMLVELAMDMELFCVCCFSWLLYYRAQAFLQHLERIVQERAFSDLNLLLCHRQLHFVLKKINKAWKIQISIILYIITFQALRNLITICVHLNENILTTIGFLLLIRYLTVFVPLCVVGQQLANVFDSIHVTAGVMRDSNHALTSSYVRFGVSMCTEGALRERRLRGGCALDAALPARLLASVGRLLVIILQLRVEFTTFDL